MSNADPRGKFVWHELLTPDAVAAAAFYTKVVPWKTQPWEQDASYTMWVAKNGPVGGIAALGDSGAPHWLPYIGVADVAGTVGTARGLGANVLKEPTDLPSGGSYAVLADPQGARFAIHKSGSAYAGAPPPAAGDFMWHELATSDVKAAMGFYTKLFGWEVGPVNDMGSAGLYHLFLREGSEYGGMYANSNVGEPSWLCYISVDDAGKAVAAAKAAGGRVLNGPEEVPGGSWVAQILDKDGAPFAVIESKMAAAASPPPAAKPAKPKAPKAEKPATAAAAPAAAEPSAAVKPAAAKPAVVKPAAKPAAAKPAPATPAAKPAAARPAGKAPAKVARKAKKAPAKGKAAKGKAAKGKAAKKSVARGKGRVVAKKAPAKKSAAGKSAGKKKSAAKRAPARKKSASRAKAKKHR